MFSQFEDLPKKSRICQNNTIQPRCDPNVQAALEAGLSGKVWIPAPAPPPGRTPYLRLPVKQTDFLPFSLHCRCTLCFFLYVIFQSRNFATHPLQVRTMPVPFLDPAERTGGKIGSSREHRREVLSAARAGQRPCRDDPQNQVVSWHLSLSTACGSRGPSNVS